MRSLLIDTSNRYLVIAAYEDDQLLKGIQEEGSKKQSEYAIPYIEAILNEHHMELFDFHTYLQILSSRLTHLKSQLLKKYNHSQAHINCPYL